MTGTLLADRAQRDRLALELDTSFFVEAGAGTGKTAAMVSRVVAMVAAGRLRMERLVAITFTVAAAAELRVRIREGLEEAAATEPSVPVRELLSTAASEVSRARIETIHAFCSALLRMHPLQAQLPPDFDTMADIAAAIDVRERFRRWFDDLEPGMPEATPIRRALLLGLTPDKMLGLFSTFADNWDQVVGARWKVGAVGAAAASREVGNSLKECIELLSHCRSPDRLHEHIDGLRPIADRLTAAPGEDHALMALMDAQGQLSLGNAGNQTNWRSVNGANACTTIKALVKGARETVKQTLAAARGAALAKVAAILARQTLEYADERRQRGALSYHDLLVRARDLIRHDRSVARSLQSSWDLIAVDEFQDTDPLQAEIALRLATLEEQADADWQALPPAPGRLCLIGDPKQSIYRFRRADIDMYQQVQRGLDRSEIHDRLELRVNFRSGRRIIDTVNAAFGDGGLMDGGAPAAGIQAEYRELAAHDPELEGSVHVLGGLVDGSSPVMWREEARAAAEVVRRILHEGWTVRKGGERRACEPHDIAMLMPTRTNLRNVERELEAAGILYQLESGSLIVATQEVRDLLNVLRSIDDPSDEVALVAALRSPGFGCSDPELARWRSAGGRWSYRAAQEVHEPHVHAALGELHRLHRERHGWSVSRLIEEIISTRLLRAAAHDDWRPQETVRRLRFVADQARALADSGRPTLHDAVDYLEHLARDPQYESVPADAVDDERCIRVMTIHSAKGLEFPVVLLTGLGRVIREPGRTLVPDPVGSAPALRVASFMTPNWEELDAREKAMQAAERVRLLYVALTRARDHLVVSLYRTAAAGAKDATLLEPCLVDLPWVERLERDAGAAARSDAGGIASSVDPGAAAGNDVEMRLDERDGALQQPGDVSLSPDEHRAEEAAWLQRRQQLLATLSGVRTQTATGLGHADEESRLGPEAGDEVAASRRGRGATSLGRAVHAVLQMADLATGNGIEALARAQATAEGIPDRAGEVAALARAAWATAVVQRAARSRHWREVPVGARIDGVLLEGFVDLLYELPDGRLVIVDYKTDDVRGAHLEERTERYRLQAGAYALLVAETTGRQVDRVELVFVAAGETRTVDDVVAAVRDVREALRAQPDPAANAALAAPV